MKIFQDQSGFSLFSIASPPPLRHIQTLCQHNFLLPLLLGPTPLGHLSHGCAYSIGLGGDFQVFVDKKVEGVISEGGMGTLFTERQRGCCRLWAEAWPSSLFSLIRGGGACVLYGCLRLGSAGREQRQPPVSHRVGRQCLKQVPPVKATRRKVKYSPFHLSRT